MSVSRYYPVYLKLQGKNVVVIGGGKVAERKILSLLEAGASVSVISPTLTRSLELLSSEKKIIHIPDTFREEQLQGVFLVMSTTDRPEVNARVAQKAKALGILSNIADDPDACDFIVPSVIERGDLVISVSTGGNSPALAKKIREELETQYGEEYAKFCQLLGAVRSKVLDEIDDGQRRAELFRKLVDSDILRLLKEGRDDLVSVKIEELLADGGARS